MYKSPIDIYVSDIMTQIEKQTDDEIYKAVVSVGINVDKAELLRALKYDRQQYEKGRQDALVEIVRCRDCERFCPCGNDSYICTSWGSWTDPDGWCYKGECCENNL